MSPLPSTTHAALLRSLPVGVLLIDKQLRVLLWNQWLAEASSISAQDAEGQLLTELFPESDMRRFQRKVDQVLLLGNSSFYNAHVSDSPLTLTNFRQINSPYPFLRQNLTLSPVNEPGLPADWVVITILDATAEVRAKDMLAESKAQLEMQQRRDSLTGVLSRRYALRRMEQALRDAELTGQDAAILMCDLDHFKEVNDLHGHLAGDEVLRRVGATLQGCLRPADLVGRFGGEEFIILLPGANMVGAKVAAERLRRSIRALDVVWERTPIPVSISIGVAEAGPDEGLMDVTGRADSALYEAKEMGRNRCVIWTPALGVTDSHPRCTINDGRTPPPAR